MASSVMAAAPAVTAAINTRLASSRAASTSGSSASLITPSSFLGSARLSATKSAATRRSTGVCRAEQSTPEKVRETILEKVDQHDSQEKESKAFIPAPGVFPRPEKERRPELGNIDFGNLMAFDGPGPETINGRLAMLGLVYAWFNERFTGLPVGSQVALGPGFAGFLFVAQVITWASLVPLAQGLSPDSIKGGPFGIFRAKAERWNGRLAMLGFSALLITEFYTRTPVFTMWPFN